MICAYVWTWVWAKAAAWYCAMGSADAFEATNTCAVASYTFAVAAVISAAVPTVSRTTNASRRHRSRSTRT